MTGRSTSITDIAWCDIRSGDKAWDMREEIKKEILEEYEKNGTEPSEEFSEVFSHKYAIDVLNAFFKWYLTDFLS